MTYISVNYGEELKSNKILISFIKSVIENRYKEITIYTFANFVDGSWDMKIYGTFKKVKSKKMRRVLICLIKVK